MLVSVPIHLKITKIKTLFYEEDNDYGCDSVNHDTVIVMVITIKMMTMMITMMLVLLMVTVIKVIILQMCVPC